MKALQANEETLKPTALKGFKQSNLDNKEIWLQVAER